MDQKQDKKAEKGKVEKGKMAAVAVIHASVRAFAGTGQVTVLVQGGNGEYRLYGATMLAKAGLLPESFYGKFVLPSVLAERLSVPIISGKAKAAAFLTDKGIDSTCVLDDATCPIGAGRKRGNSAVF